MKKYLLVMALALMSLGANAQKLQGVKDFLGGFKYEIMVGYNTSVANEEPYNSAKIGYNLGVTARKEVKTFMDDKLGVYGLMGLVLTSRGGKQDVAFDKSFGDDDTWSVSGISVPIHIGGEYKFKKISLFADLGPHVLFAKGSSDIEKLTNSSVAFGGGFNMGIRFKKFAMSFGVDQDFTKLGTYKDSDGNKNLTDGEFHFDLRWTL